MDLYYGLSRKRDVGFRSLGLGNSGSGSWQISGFRRSFGFSVQGFGFGGFGFRVWD